MPPRNLTVRTLNVSGKKAVICVSFYARVKGFVAYRLTRIMSTAMWIALPIMINLE